MSRPEWEITKPPSREALTEMIDRAYESMKEEKPRRPEPDFLYFFGEGTREQLRKAGLQWYEIDGRSCLPARDLAAAILLHGVRIR